MLTSPPPTTTICLSFACHATINEPPPWTGGNLCDIVEIAMGLYTV